ncbi:Ectonucleoside triphosphate diphosphohydrolase [Perkinsus chesapeaki]|uniref:Ectonucleoside triphosphate diphosphohydrolase n=1 Tax=Perkinsus chesapeaki TaxID=330153 RepID=A0A7J6MG32_PERCH|nr:Ectonucleoside triphosphate diphosphohydrolase [Perkinsus chesapeaki]
MYEPHAPSRHVQGSPDASVKRRLDIGKSPTADDDYLIVGDIEMQDKSEATKNEPAFDPKLLAMNPIAVTVTSMKARTWKLLRSYPLGMVRAIALAFVLLLSIAILIRFGRDLRMRVGPYDPVYKVVLDAGSTGTRVHVFKFRRRTGEEDLLLERTSNPEMTFFRKVDGGLSLYKNNPEEARRGLQWLLEEAASGVPEAVGAQALLLATAGLRLIPRESAEELLQVSRSVIRESPFTLVRDDDVAILDGSDEGLYMWRSVDFSYGRDTNITTKPSAVVDLGGGSVQLAYRLHEGPEVSPSVEAKFSEYLRPVHSTGLFSTPSRLRIRDYFLASAADTSTVSPPHGPLYVHSWLGYGLEAARKRILEENVNGTSPCIVPSDSLPEFYDYAGVRLSVHSDDRPSATRYERCLEVVREALDLDEDCGARDAAECAFDGAWRGPMDPSNYTFRVFSYVFDVARANGLVPSGAHEIVTTVVDFRRVAQQRCWDATAGSSPWACLDAVYVTSLLSDGFGISDTDPIIAAERLTYDDNLLYAAWPLGAALERLEN